MCSVRAKGGEGIRWDTYAHQRRFGDGSTDDPSTDGRSPPDDGLTKNGRLNPIPRTLRIALKLLDVFL